MAKDQITKPELLLIGGSSGSLGIVLSILSALPGNYPVSILLVMHRGNSQESLLNEVLGIKSNMPVVEVEEKEPIRASRVYLAPADYHVLIEKNKTFSLDYSEKQNYSRPSIDVSFTSAAEVYGPHLMGILLSGANDDGTAGMLSIKNRAGIVSFRIRRMPWPIICRAMPLNGWRQMLFYPDRKLSVICFLFPKAFSPEWLSKLFLPARQFQMASEGKIQPPLPLQDPQYLYWR